MVLAEKNKDEEEFLWLKNINYSCRYDSFLLIYALTIKNLLIKLNYKSLITDLYNNLVDKIFNMSKNELEDGIWILLDNLNLNKYDFISKGYKLSYPVSQLIAPLKNNNIFSFKYKSQLYYYMRSLKEEVEKYIGPIIEINKEDLNKDLPCSKINH